MSKKIRVARIANLKDAKFAYISTCCNEVAEKPPCALGLTDRVGTTLGSTPEERTLTLGSWRCPKCKKPCKVSRIAKVSVTEVSQ